MKKTIIFTAFLLIFISIKSQTFIDSVLNTVLINNTTLNSFRNSINVDKIHDRIGLTLQNPEFEFNYLWGNNSLIGNRTDISIRQTIDFPTTYLYKKQIADIKNNQSELDFIKYRNEIINQTRLVCSDIQYFNSLLKEAIKRKDHAKILYESYKRKFDLGEVNLIEFNKVNLFYLNASNEVDKIEIELESKVNQLIQLNKGFPIPNNFGTLPTIQIEPNFEKWYNDKEQNNPILKWLRLEIELSYKQKQLAISKTLPQFYLGYMSEKVLNQQYQGIHVGLTIPLWEHKNTIKACNAQIVAVKSIESDTKFQFYNNMHNIHSKVILLQESLEEYKQSIKRIDNSLLLQKAFEKGEISISEYIIEFTYNYESFRHIIDLERELNVNYIELLKYVSY